MAAAEETTAATKDDTELLLERLSKNASNKPSKNAISFLVPSQGSGHKVENQFTYEAVEAETSSLAAFLLEKGLQKGDRALLVYPPSLDFMIAFLACLKAGVIAVPVFPPNPTRKDTLFMFSRITESCGAKHALTNVAYNHMKKISGIRDTFAKFNPTRQQNNVSWPEQLEWIITNNRANSEKSSTLTVEPDPSDLAFLQYTSGSTSEPKGVMITHANLAHNLSIITNELEAVEDTVVVSWLPQYHDMGLIGSYLGVLYCGGSGWYMSPLSFLQRPMLWLEAVSKYKATHLQAPNFAFKLTARKLDPSSYNNSNSNSNSNNVLDLSSVRHVINAAEPVDEDSIKSFMKAFGPFGFGDVIYPTYGLAEHTVFVCSGGKQIISVLKEELELNQKVVLHDEAETETVKETEADQSTGIISRLVGCGYPARQGVDVKIVNPETLLEVDTDSVGEIWVHSSSKAKGYYQKEQDTKDLFHATILGPDKENSPDDQNYHDDGYLRTGDLGFLFNNELFICGRLKDLIIVGGRNYYPQDIEATAESTSELLRPGCSAAFTIDPTHEGGEEVALILELRQSPKDVDKTCQPLADLIRSSINAEHSLALTQIIFLHPKTVPKTTSGKIARAWCRKALLGGKLNVIYNKSFKSQGGIVQQPTQPAMPIQTLSKEKVAEIRAMDKNDILDKLVMDVCKMSSMPTESIDKQAAIITMLDSMTISQFKGLLESGYAVKLSDEYLFRESTTLNKLVEVVKLGYAPDDDGEDGTKANHEGVGASQGTAGGIAGALGCPPGVVCCVIQ